MSKACSVCRLVLPESGFYRNGARLRAHCKECEKARVRRHQTARPELGRERSRRWRKANPEKHAETQAKRRATSRSSVCSCCSPEQRKQFYIERPIGMTVDHVIPLTRGGLHCVHNFQYLSRSENASKGNRVPEHCHF